MPNHCDPAVEQAIHKLAEDFPRLRWDFSPDPGSSERVSHWLGEEDEDVMVNVFKRKRINEQFHRQDFFFLHFAWQGDYDALSANYSNRITIREGSCYIRSICRDFFRRKREKPFPSCCFPPECSARGCCWITLISP